MRFRHTDSDLYRLARQQEFVRAFRDAGRAELLGARAAELVSTSPRTSRSARRRTASAARKLIIIRALRAVAARRASLPGQDRERAVLARLPGVAVRHPGGCRFVPEPRCAVVEGREHRRARQQGRSRRRRRRRDRDRDGPERQRCRRRRRDMRRTCSTARLQDAHATERRPGRHADSRTTSTPIIYYDPAQAGRRPPRSPCRTSCSPPTSGSCPTAVPPNCSPSTPARCWSSRSARRSTGRFDSLPQTNVPQHVAASVRADAARASSCSRALQKKVSVPALVPTILERNSTPDTAPGDEAVRTYWIDGRRASTRWCAARSGRSTGATSTGGSRRRTGTAPLHLPTTSFRHDLGGREFDLDYRGRTSTWSCSRRTARRYWV